MKKWPAFTRSPEVVGLFCGVGMAACKTLHPNLAVTPIRVLGCMVLLACLAGFTTAAVSSRTLATSYHSVRRGARAGMVAALAAGAILVLVAWSFTGASLTWRGLMLAAVSLLPSMFAGTIASGVGCFCFRRKTVTPVQEDGTDIREWSRWLRIATWSLVGLLWAAAVSAPFFPRHRPPQSVGAVRWASASHPALDAFKSAPPAAWSVSTVTHLSRLHPETGFAMSKDQRWIVGVDGAFDHSLAIISLDSEEVSRTPPLPFPVATAVFNETADRLLVISEEATPRLAVVELASHRVIVLPQPKKAAVPKGPVYWWRDHEVIFDPPGRPRLALDLDALELSPAELRPEEQARLSQENSPGLPKTDRWQFVPGGMLVSVELPEIEGSAQWNLLAQQRLTLVDSQAVYTRVFPEIDVAPDDGWRSVAEGSKILRFRNGFLDVIHFDTRPIPPLRWKLGMPCGPDDMPGSGQVAKALRTGNLAMLLYAPLVNPLNSQTIGPDRSKPKAILTVAEWQDHEAQVSVCGDALPWQPGDVLADLFVTGATPELLSFDQPHRWWTLCPDPKADAVDPAQLPKRDEIEKRRQDERTERQRQELAERQKNEEARRKKIETAPVVVSPAPPVTPPVSVAAAKVPQASADSIASFIVQHHRRASEGRIREMVQDYGEMVDHFNNGVVAKSFILEDETKYHQNFSYVYENVVGDVKVTALGEGIFQAQYVMQNHWQKAADGKQGGGQFDVALVLQQTDGSWKIIKHHGAVKK